MTIGFFGILLALSVALLIYPFLIYPLILALLPPISPLKAPAGAGPKSAVLLFAARNEARDLPATLRALRDLHRLWPELRIRAWNDASTDATAEMLDGTRDFIEVRHGRRPLGKGAALARLVCDSPADLVLMMDANTRFEPEAILRLRACFADPGIGAAGAGLKPLGGSESAVGRAYWALEERIKALESRSGSSIGCDGAFWGIRRHLYPAFGARESDDFRPSMEALLAGYRVVTAADVAVAEPAMPDAGSPVRAARIACGAWHAHRSIRPRLRAAPFAVRFRYVSHKLIRWFAGLWLAVATASALGLAWAVGWGGAALFAVVAAGLAMAAGIPPFGGIGRICANLLATSFGVLMAMQGKSVETWVPARAEPS